MNALLEHLVTARLNILLARQAVYSPLTRIARTVVPTDRLIHLTRGSVHYQLEERVLELNEGDLLLVPAMTSRSWECSHTAGCEMRWMEWVIHPAGPALPAVHLPGVDETMATQLNAIFAAVQKGSSSQSLLTELSLKHLIAMAVDRTAAVVRTSKTPSRDSSRLITLLRQHLHQPDALEKLQRDARLTGPQLRTRLRSLTGQSPSQYLQTLRMQHARFLLSATDLSVKEVASRCGFDDPLYFSRRYRLFWKRTPTQDRAPNP